MPTRLSFLCFVLVLQTACLDEIEIKPPKGIEEGLVVRGELVQTKDAATISIYVGNIFNFEIGTLAAVRLQQVVLIDENGVEMEIPRRRTNFYQYKFDAENDPIKIAHYQQYKVRVKTLDERIYESSFEQLLPLPKGEMELYAERSVFPNLNERNERADIDAMQFFVNTSLDLEGSDEPARLFWTVQRTYKITDNNGIVCYITAGRDFNNIHLLDGSLLTETDASNIPITKVVLDYEFAEGHTYTAIRKSMTEGGFEYWKQIKESIERQGLLFEPVVGKVNSNFSNVEDPQDSSVFGYFTAYSQDTMRLYLPPDFGLDLHCPIPCPPGPPPLCCECQVQTGSSTKIPFFWEG